jgi:hypothetical protein
MLTRVLATRTLFAASLLLVASNARADQPLRVALFKAASEDTSLQTLAAALDPVLLAELGNVPDLQIAARPALDLPSMQLAIDCVGETAECLSSSAKQAEADGLIAPAVRKLGAEIVVTILLYDARRQLSIRGATRRYASDQVDSALDGVRGMVRELFGLEVAPPAASPPPEAAAPAAASAPTSPQPSAAKPLPVLPIVLGAAGVALLGAGVGLGLASQSSEDAYTKIKVTDEASGQRALDKLGSARTEATLANVAYGVGAAALATGVVVFILQAYGAEQGPSAAQSVPMAFRAGELTLSGHWD